jgi:hypothetical protein
MSEQKGARGMRDEVHELLTQWSEYAYPAEVFPDLTEAQWEDLQAWCQSQGFPLDRLSGNYGRVFTRPYVEVIRQAIAGLEEGRVA